MKKNVNGIEYDTKLSTKLDTYDNGLIVRYMSNRSDYYYREELYRTPSGEFFLYAIGGRLSQYAGPVQDGRHTVGEDIIPKTQSEAVAWLGEHHHPIDAEKILKKILQK